MPESGQVGAHAGGKSEAKKDDQYTPRAQAQVGERLAR